MRPVPWLDNETIESQMEYHLGCSKLWPQETRSVFDIEAFLIKYLRADFDITAPLASDVLGRVTFISGRKPQVEINADLTLQAENEDELWKVGRWRMTVAHESAHIILHGPLYVSADQTQLFLTDEPKVHTCYKHELPEFNADSQNFVNEYGWDSKRLINESSQKKRMEVQANIAAAALLMPRSVFVPLAHQLFEQARENLAVPDQRCDWVIARLANRFNVSRRAARIRCNDLNLLRFAEQASLT